MNQASDIFKALSEPTRLRIMALLTRGELCVCDLMAVLELPQSTVSRHIGRLKQAGLIADRRAGQWVYYRLNAVDSPLAVGVQGIVRELLADEPHRSDLVRLAEHAKTKTC